MKINWKRQVFRYTKPEPLTMPSIKDVVLRLLIGVISGIWLAFFPIYLFVIYMFREQFFSYDFFTDGIFGLKTFIVALLVLMIFLSFILWGFLIFGRIATIEREKKDGKFLEYQIYTYIFLVISVSFHFMFYYLGGGNKVSSALMPISIIGCTLTLAIASFFGSKILKIFSNWVAPLLFIFVSAFTPLCFLDVTADLVSIGLITFNVGGGVNAKIVKQDDAKTVIHEGKLLLLTPKNAYFREGKRGYRVIQQSESVSVVVPRDET